MMLLEFYVEEPSMEAALIELVPRILATQSYEFNIYVHQGKPDLLRKLPQRLRAYRHYPHPHWRVIVVVDRDNDDCYTLKRHLDKLIQDAGLIPKQHTLPRQAIQTLTRIAIEELEAWFFGDTAALITAYPSLPADLAHQAAYRNPDAIKGGTAEQLERLLMKYHAGGLEKIRAAAQISQHMNPDINQSRSFQVFRDGLRSLFDVPHE